MIRVAIGSFRVVMCCLPVNVLCDLSDSPDVSLDTSSLILWPCYNLKADEDLSNGDCRSAICHAIVTNVASSPCVARWNTATQVNGILASGGVTRHILSPHISPLCFF